jgi:hypothetical protein
LLKAAKCASENFNLNEFNLKEADYDDEKPPSYKLRANEEKFSSSINTNTNANNNHNCDWIRAPSYFDEQQISELTNEQIQFTLDYFSKQKINKYIFLFSLLLPFLFEDC